MGFPIKKRINTSPVFASEDRHHSTASPSGLDLLSAAIDSSRGPQHAQTIAVRSLFEGKIATVSTAAAPEDCSSSASENECRTDSSSTSSNKSDVSQAMSNTYNSTHKRAKTFPEILMAILSNPDHVSIVGWLPRGKSFTIHDPSKFSSQILPKYFRRVIFRSFVRKLNRWGFRSVKRSMSGFESTFEHTYFSRDEPELCTKMYCMSNPTSRAASKKNGSSTSGMIGSSDTNNTNTISPSSSATSASSAAMIAQVQSSQAPLSFSNNSLGSRLSHNEDFQVQLSNELMLRELQQQRQQTLTGLIHQMPMNEADIVNHYIAEKWQQLLLVQRQQRRLSGL